MDQSVARGEAAAGGSEPPLVVGLHALLRIDPDAEARRRRLLRRAPDGASPPPSPLDDGVADFVRRERARGRRIHLASGLPPEAALAAAAAAGPFDGVFEATDRRLGDLLGATFGERGFDYLGARPGDLHAWSRARRAYTARAPRGVARSLAEAAAAGGAAAHVVTPRRSWVRPLVAGMRPHQWAKNLLVLVPALAAHRTDPATLLSVATAFLAFCLVASAVYLANDLVDADADRAHPRKCRRPIASGDLPIGIAAAAAPLLFPAGLAAAAFVSPAVLAILAGYVVVTTAYSLAAKRVAILDVATLAGLYTVRVWAGGAAAGVVLSPWLLGFAVFLFLSLALVKRVTELSGSRRSAAAGRGYRRSDLPVLMSLAGAAGYAAVVVLALYIESPDMARLYASPWGLWAVAAILLFWISRTLLLARRGDLHDDPVVFAFTDRTSRIAGCLAAAAVLASSLPHG